MAAAAANAVRDPAPAETPAEALARLMAEQGISQRALASRATEAGRKIDQASISRILQGKLVVTLDTAQALAGVLGVSPALFLPELAGFVAPAGEPAEPGDGQAQVILAHLCPSPLNPRRTYHYDGFEQDFAALVNAAREDTGDLVDLVERLDLPPGFRDLAERAQSIERNGLLQNLVARSFGDGGPMHWIVAGETRYWGLELLKQIGRLPAGLGRGIPCKIVSVSEAEHRALALLENLQRADVNPMEEAEAFAELQDNDPEAWTPAKIAKRIGMTTRHVQLRLRLARHLVPEAKAKLKAGELKLAQCRALASFPEATQRELVNDCFIEGDSPEDIREQGLRGMPSAKVAIFDVTASGLETWEDLETGELLFRNRDAFLAMQRDAVKDLAERLRREEKPTFVKIFTNYFPSYNYPDGGKGICIVLEHDGTVEIRRGRQDETRGQDTDPAEALRQKIASEFDRERDMAQTAFKPRLQASIDVPDALALLVANAALSYDQRPLASGTLYAPADASKPGEPFALFVPLEEMGSIPLKTSDKAFRLAAGLAADAPDTLDKAFVAIVRQAVHFQYAKALHPVWQELARRKGIEIPPILLLAGKTRSKEIDRRVAAAIAAAEPQQLDIEDAIAETDSDDEDPDEADDDITEAAEAAP